MKGEGMLKQLGLALLIFAIFSSMLHAETKQDEKFPFFPSLLGTVSGKPIKAEDYAEPEVCAGCHTDIFKQWNGSMHSQAFVDPVFQALWKLGAKETKGFTDKLCGGCHAAAGVVSNDLVFKDNEFFTSAIAKRGVHCDLCHTVKETRFPETPTREPQNASIIVDPGNVKRGPYKDSESPFHETAYSELHTKSEFCANCHNVFHPVNNFHIEHTYAEWKFSVYAQNGIQCQDCHMMPVEKAIEAARTLKKQKNPGQPAVGGPQREQMYTHEFVGANFTVPALLKFDLHKGIAEKRLKSAAELSVDAPQTAAPGSLVTVAVKVRNVGAGHNLPTSLTEVRQMWLDVQATDVTGKEIFRSGALDKDGEIDPKAKIYNANAVDKEGKHTVKPWEITRFEYNNTIPPKGSATESYAFLVPQNVKGAVTIKAVLRYRSFPQSVANLLLGKDAPVLPIVDMKEAGKTIAIN
jgi:hypothetical protein